MDGRAVRSQVPPSLLTERIGDATLGRRALELVWELLADQRPKRILEFGSGLSTLLFGLANRELELSAQVVSVEHNPRFLERTLGDPSGDRPGARGNESLRAASPRPRRRPRLSVVQPARDRGDQWVRRSVRPHRRPSGSLPARRHATDRTGRDRPGRDNPPRRRRTDPSRGWPFQSGARASDRTSRSSAIWTSASAWRSSRCPRPSWHVTGDPESRLGPRPAPPGP